MTLPEANARINKLVSLEEALMRDNLKLILVFLAIFLTLGAIFYDIAPTFAQSDQANTKLQSANAEVKAAFISIYDAKATGANVTILIKQLNDAADLLAQAENAYRQNDSNTAIIKSDGVVLIAQQVKAAAQSANQSASASNQTALWLTIGISIVAAVIFLIALFLIWNWFKHRHVEDLLQKESEVQINET